MTQSTQQEARRRAFRYQFEDGMLEIAQGTAFSLIGLFVWLVSGRDLAGTNKVALLVGFIVFAVALTAGVALLINRYKDRITYPRTGRVNYQSEPREELRSSAAVILVALLIAAAALWLDGWFVTTTTIVGATITLIMLSTGIRSRIQRMQLAALLPLLISLMAALAGIDETLGAAIVFIGTGLGTLVLGLIALRRYLRNYPEPENED